MLPSQRRSSTLSIRSLFSPNVIFREMDSSFEARRIPHKAVEAHGRHLLQRGRRFRDGRRRNPDEDFLDGPEVGGSIVGVS